MTESVRTSGRQQENYHPSEYTYMKRSGYNVGVSATDTDHYEKVTYERQNYYPETYVEIDSGFKKFKNNQIIAL